MWGCRDGPSTTSHPSSFPAVLKPSDGGSDKVLGNSPVLWRLTHTPKRDGFAYRDSVIYFIGCELNAFSMGFRPKNARLNVTRFISQCFANGTNDIESRFSFRHMRLSYSRSTRNDVHNSTSHTGTNISFESD
jgi:hypothetical protein